MPSDDRTTANAWRLRREADARSRAATRCIREHVQVIVRAATSADVEAIARVHVESWRSAYRGLLPDDYLDGLSVERRTEVWRRLVADVGDDRGVLVLDDQGIVVGFSHYAQSRDDDADLRAGEVTSTYLLASHWRRSGGSQLLEAALGRLRDAGCHRAALWVLEGNERASAFYEAHGWVADGSSKVDNRGTVELHETRYGIRL